MISTLVVEDDPRIADAHAQFTARVPGFAVAGTVHRGSEALDFLDRRPVDLVLLDFYLPDMTGLDVCRGLRAHGHLADIIAVTSARDVQIVRSALAYGVVQYLLKPFTFAAFRDKLERYAEYRRRLAGHGRTAAQQDLDRAFGALRGSVGGPLPKGMSNQTLSSVVDALREHAPRGLTASETADRLGMARVTTRRYLEHLAGQGLVSRRPRYGTQGRPEHVYHWSDPAAGRA
ncbi:response regulator [Streptomyces sp. XM4011]|uniref:Transcriptional regulatory protein n=2 Tax=Streptomyces TaxID=1883 RepID=A0A1I6W497_9ACTN|nr:MULTISPECIES: response regulator [Streptomyces]MCK1815102.1 response regulator [Streptomyces sp. XM4011]SFT20813.1 Response regulator of citrate/malate metabolism [Streptomyces harbinensis]